jgi:hypothetical protein
MYDTCQYSPCFNGARCVPSNTDHGFRCICTQGFTGDRCELQGLRCYPGNNARDAFFLHFFLGGVHIGIGSEPVTYFVFGVKVIPGTLGAH